MTSRIEKIRSNIMDVRKEIESITDKSIDIVAVTKYASVDDTAAIAQSGLISICGENKWQDGGPKTLQFPEINWHFIGHLQSNKVNKVMDHFDMIQSVDSLKLAEKINRLALENNKRMPVLIQVNAGMEEAKSGFSFQQLESHQDYLASLAGLDISGMMVVAPYLEDTRKLGRLFQSANQVFEKWQQHSKMVKILSMGMSGDYKIAIQEGSTMIRIGSSLLKE